MSLKNIGHKAGARWKLSQLMTPLITLVMLGVTFGYWQKEKRESDEARLHLFHEASDQVTNGIQGRLQNFELVLRGFKGLYESSDNLTPSDYRQYFQVLKLDQALASLQAVSPAVHVPQADKARHLADMQSRGLVDYQIKPAGERAEYAPIVLIEPFAGSNVKALDFAIASNPGLLVTLERAHDSGVMALTGRFTLVLQSRSPLIGPGRDHPKAAGT